MKESKSILAMVKALGETLEWLYDKMDSEEREAQNYINEAEKTEEEEKDDNYQNYYRVMASQHWALSAAFAQLAERLGKGVV